MPLNDALRIRIDGVVGPVVGIEVWIVGNRATVKITRDDCPRCTLVLRSALAELRNMLRAAGRRACSRGNLRFAGDELAGEP